MGGVSVVVKCSKKLGCNAVKYVAVKLLNKLSLEN